MVKFVGETEESWGLALSRRPDGNLSDVTIGLSKTDALNMYDNLQSVALLKVTLEVVSSIDGEIGIVEKTEREPAIE